MSAACAQDIYKLLPWSHHLYEGLFPQPPPVESPVRCITGFYQQRGKVMKTSKGFSMKTLRLTTVYPEHVSHYLEK